MAGGAGRGKKQELSLRAFSNVTRAKAWKTGEYSVNAGTFIKHDLIDAENMIEYLAFITQANTTLESVYNRQGTLVYCNMSKLLRWTNFQAFYKSSLAIEASK